MSTFKVINNNDSGKGSLRQAIAAAYINPGADVIDLTNVSGSIKIESTLYLNLDDLTIIDKNSDTTLDGGNKVHIMDINGASVILDGM